MQNWTITRVHNGERYVAPLRGVSYEDAMAYLDVVCALNPQDTYTLKAEELDLSAASEFLGRGLL